MADNSISGEEANKSETISQLAHRHMKDKNHTTSDEELKNATFELDTNIPIIDNSLSESKEDLTPDNEDGETHYLLPNA